MAGLTGTDLEGYELLEGMRTEDLAAMAACGKRVEVAAGETLFRQGEAANAFCLLEAGRVVVMLESPGGETANVLAVGRREPFGWSSVIAPRVYTGGAQALDRSQILWFDATALLKVFEQRTDLGYRFMARLAAIIAKRLKEHWVDLCARTNTRRTLSS